MGTIGGAAGSTKSGCSRSTPHCKRPAAAKCRCFQPWARRFPIAVHEASGTTCVDRRQWLPVSMLKQTRWPFIDRICWCCPRFTWHGSVSLKIVWKSPKARRPRQGPENPTHGETRKRYAINSCPRSKCKGWSDILCLIVELPAACSVTAFTGACSFMGECLRTRTS